jgi:hypothetical protein
MGKNHEKARSRLYLAALAAALLAFFAPAASRTFIFRDAFNLFYPYKAVEAGYLRSFEVCRWNPYETLGSPFVGELATSWFYPGNLPFILLAPEPALRVFILGHFLLAALFLWLLLRELGASPPARFAGAAAYTLSGFVLSQNGLPDMLAAAAWLPASLFFLLRYARGRRLAHLGLFSATLALPFLAGRAEASAMNAIAAAAFFIASDAAGAGLKTRTLRAAWLFPAAAAFALALALAQFLPSLELGLRSIKGQGFGLEEAMRWSLHPRRLLELLLSAPWGKFWPEQTYRGWELTGWPGFYPFALSEYLGLPALAGTAVFLATRPWRTRILFGAGLLAAILLSLGRYSFLFPAIYRAAPGMGVFRYPEKFMLLAVLLLSGAGALGLDRVLAAIERRAGTRAAWAREGAGALLALAVFLDLFFSNRWIVPYADPEIYRFRPAALDLLAGPARRQDPDLFLPDGRPRPGAFRVMREPMTPPAPVLGTLPGKSPLERWRRWERHTLMPNFNFVEGYEFLTGYTAAATSDFNRVMAVGISSRMLALYNVRYALVPAGRTAPGIQDLSRVGVRNDLGFALVRIPDTMPRAYLVGESLRVRESLERLDLLAAHDFRRAVVLEDGADLPPAAEERALAATPATIVRYEPERVEIAADAPAPAYLVLSDSFYPGWEARVDGKPATIHRANFLARAVRVPAGEHRVVFCYRPRLGPIGLLVSGASWLALLALIVTPVLRRRTGR